MMSAQIGLYYPYFHFPGDDWAKIAALYWDKVYRIVPSGYSTKRDSYIIKTLSSGIEGGPIFGRIMPEMHHEERQIITNNFIRLIENHTNEIVRYYGVENRNNWTNPEPAFLHSLKIERELTNFLLSRNLCVIERDSSGRKWVGMHRRLTDVYMSALAELLATGIKAHLLTTDTTNYFAVSGFTFERLAQVLLDKAKITPDKPVRGELESVLATIAFRGVMPKNVTDVPIEKILEIREKYSGERGHFQDFIHKIVTELPHLEDVGGEAFVHDHLEAEYKKVVRPKLDELEDALNSLGIETIPSIFNMEINLPGLLIGAGVFGTTIVEPLLGATAAVALGLLKVLGDRRKVMKKKMDKSKVVYLMHIRENLTPAGSLDWLNIQARKAIFGI